jgi:hypothetical protein
VVHVRHDVGFLKFAALVLISTVLSVLLMPAMNAYSGSASAGPTLRLQDDSQRQPYYVHEQARRAVQEHAVPLGRVVFHSHPAIARQVAAAEA